MNQNWLCRSPDQHKMHQSFSTTKKDRNGYLKKKSRRGKKKGNWKRSRRKMRCNTTSRKRHRRQQQGQPEKLTMLASKQQHKQTQSSKRKATTSIILKPKKSRAAENTADEIHSKRCFTCSNWCCTCFGLYSDDFGTDRVWLKCFCGRWIHEECVDENNINSSATKLCFFVRHHYN